MRKGAKRVEWTTEEVRYLLEHAGIDSKRSICRHLRRSHESVKQKAKQLRAEGYDISLRVYQTLTVICPKCSQARSKEGRWTGRTGFCEVCRMRDSYQEALWRQAEAYADLTPEQRQEYDRTQPQTGRSNLPPRPKMPQTIGMSPQRARRVSELHAIEVEQWEKRCLTMLTNAVKKRTQHIREKAGTNPRKKKVETNDTFDETPDRRH